jgi:hypothetical protein
VESRIRRNKKVVGSGVTVWNTVWIWKMDGGSRGENTTDRDDTNVNLNRSSTNHLLPTNLPRLSLTNWTRWLRCNYIFSAQFQRSRYSREPQSEAALEPSSLEPWSWEPGRPPPAWAPKVWTTGVGQGLTGISCSKGVMGRLIPRTALMLDTRHGRGLLVRT